MDELCTPACLVHLTKCEVIFSNGQAVLLQLVERLKRATHGDYSLLKSLSTAVESRGHFSLDAFDDYSIRSLQIAQDYALVIFEKNEGAANVLSNASALIIRCTNEGIVLDHNPIAAQLLTNNKHGDLQGSVLFDFITENSKLSLYKLLSINGESKIYQHTEVYLKDNHGSNKRILVQAVPSTNEQNSHILVLHVIDEQLEYALNREEERAANAEELNEVLKLEIKEHTQTQKKLSQAQRYARSIIDSSVEMIVSLDGEMLIKEFNRTSELITGYRKEEVVGKPFKNFLDSEVHVENVLLEVSKHGLWEGELIFLKKDKSTLQLQAIVSLLRNESMSLLGYVCSMRDITQTKEAEDFAREQQAKIEAIFNSGSVMFWTVNKNTSLTSFNKEYAAAFERLYGEPPEVNKDVNKPKKRFASDIYHDFWNNKYKNVFETGEREYFQTNTKDKSGKENYRDIFLSPIFNPADNSIKEVAGMAIDTTEKMAAEHKMNEQSAKIKAIFNASNHMIWSVGEKFEFTSFNESFEKRMQNRFGKKPVLNGNAVDFIEGCCAGKGEEWLNWYKKVLKGDKAQFEDLITDILGKEHLEEVSLSPISNEKGKVVEIAALSQTVTFKRAAERKLKEQAAKINAIFDSTAMLIWTVDKNLRIIAFNKIFANQHFKLLGKEVSIGSRFTDEVREAISPNAILELELYFDNVFQGKKQQFEGVMTDKSGQTHWMEIFLNPIYLESGEIKEISCLSYEITDKKEIQQQMLESIHEKEVLLQEVHHRVKNNLQVISSILNLQSSYVKDENSLNILRESQNRIKSMSFIHESLYHTRDFSKIEFSDYIMSLSGSLIHSYSIGLGRINLNTDCQKIYLVLDQAIPCGLIVNELVSNALKYAFPDNQSGEITMKLKEVEGKINLSIADNGIGLPEDLDVKNSESLGLQLVYTLADQLDADIQVKGEKGTEYLITFDKQ